MHRETQFDHLHGGRSASRVIGDQATRRCGVITRPKLLALGLSERQVDRRRDDGDLRETRYDGVYVVGHSAPVPGQREAIALAASGPGAHLAGRSAAAWRGMTDPWRGDVEVLVPPGRHSKLPGIARSTAHLPALDASSCHDLPCTTPERTAVDLPPDRLRQALQWLMKRAIAIEPLVERMRGRRGAKAFRAEVAGLIPQMAHTMSELEDRFLRLCRRYAIPLPVVNGTLAGGDLIDCAWPGHRLAVELDGRRWHEHRDREDRARDHRRLSDGLVAARFDWWDVTRDHRATAAQVLRLLAQW